MDEPHARPVVIFDGVCVLCSHTVQFILAHEQAPVFAFAGTQSPEGQRLAADHGITPDALDETFVVVTGGRALIRSDAALEIAKHLRTPWRWLAVLRFIPRPARDAAYSAVARRRYRLFGRMESCFIPPPGMRDRFLGSPPPAGRSQQPSA